MTNNKRTSDSSSSGSSNSDNNSSNNSSESDESSDYSDDEVKIEKEVKEEQEEFEKISQEIQKSKKKSNFKKEIIKRGVIYLSRIPHGFYEEQMRSYFGQFGTVTNLKLFRNKKTGKSQHFAFIEFESIEVAEIVVETMDNYLLLNHILKCKLIPESQVNPNLWKGTKKKFIPLDYLTLAKEKHNRRKTKEEVDKQVERLLKKEEKKRKRLLDLGIDYDFPGYAACVMKEPEHKRFKE